MKYTKNLSGSFEGWSVEVDSPLLFDNEGNFYHIDEIRAIFYNRQLIKSLTGTKTDHKIQSLALHLEKKIAATDIPKVKVEWSDGRSVVLNHPLLDFG